LNALRYSRLPHGAAGCSDTQSLTDRSVNAGIVGFRGSTQPTGVIPLADVTSLDSRVINTTVWHDGIDKNSSHEIGVATRSISENRLIEVSSIETSFT
jgi:hypothetical protein